MTETADFLGKGWKYPVICQNGKIIPSKGKDSIVESIKLILGTSKGERIMRPDFGCEINDLVFEVNNTATSTLVAYHVEEALVKWEPRIEVLDVDATPNEDDPSQLIITIDYEIKSSNSKANLVYPFYLEGKE